MLKKMKKMQIILRMAVGFLIMGLLIVISLYKGYTSVKGMMTAADPEQYLADYASFTAIFFIAITIIMSGMSIYIMICLNRGLKELKRGAKSIELGDTNVTLTKHADDEFGEVIDAFQLVLDGIKYQAEVAQEVAAGNMLVDVTPRSEVDDMGNALKKMVEQNKNTLTNISEAASQVTSGASQVANASDALAEGSTDQASSIQEITASIADVAEKTKQNAAQANTASNLMTQAIGEVEKGNAEMKEMMVAMEDINKASENISKIIKVIDDIAFQTNILALNAAVEAARAGEAGKGFAVVAEEVRNLAAKSASAAAETAELIEDSIRKIQVGSKLANNTDAALAEITKVVTRSEQIVTDIASASNQQASAIAQIDQAVEQVSYVVQTNSATSEECAAASQELLEQAARVRELISAYRI